MPLPIEKAKRIAKANLSQLHNVDEWSDLMEYESSKYFSRKYRNQHGKRPKKALIQMKVDRFKELIDYESELNNYTIARKIGLADEIALYKFIKRHTGKSPTEWRIG